MSAWIVSKKHIDALVTALLDFGLVSCELHSDCKGTKEIGDECLKYDVQPHATALGKMLWLENHRSVNFRYSRRERAPKYVYERVELDAIALIKQIDCYGYQSMEHKAWDKSKANKLMWTLQDKLYSGLPMDAADVETTSEYNDAAWGI